MKIHCACACALLLVACGGDVQVDASSSGQGGGQSSSGQGASGASGSTASSGAQTSSGITSVASSGTGGGPCDEHADCGPDAVCIFATGTCAPACEGDFCDSCSVGTICNACATSSCPKCADCRGACVPTPPGGCDDDDPCPPEAVCVFQMQQCAPICIPTNTGCEDPNLVCAGCVTGSCCGCDDCVSACVPLEG